MLQIVRDFISRISLHSWNKSRCLRLYDPARCCRSRNRKGIISLQTVKGLACSFADNSPSHSSGSSLVRIDQESPFESPRSTKPGSGVRSGRLLCAPLTSQSYHVSSEVRSVTTFGRRASSTSCCAVRHCGDTGYVATPPSTLRHLHRLSLFMLAGSEYRAGQGIVWNFTNVCMPTGILKSGQRKHNCLCEKSRENYGQNKHGSFF